MRLVSFFRADFAELMSCMLIGSSPYQLRLCTSSPRALHQKLVHTLQHLILFAFELNFVRQVAKLEFEYFIS